MKIRTEIICLFMITMMVYSCKKEKVAIPSSQVNSNTDPVETYNIPNSVGSYWVYECNNRDINGNITSMEIIDTVKIIGDTIINGQTFITYEGTNYGGSPLKWFQRDSSGYIIDDAGKIIYSTTNFTDTLNSSFDDQNQNQNYNFKTAWIMKQFTGQQTVVPAGSFNAIDYQGHWRKVNGENFSGCGIDVYIVHNYFDPNVGLLKNNRIYFNQLEYQCSDMERVLIKYHIE